MLVWNDGQAGTIGGGRLEFESVERARRALSAGDRFDRIPLGPALGQCCGGTVQLVTEIWDADRLASIEGGWHARPLPGTKTPMPLKMAGVLRAARAGQGKVTTTMVQGWIAEPVSEPDMPVWIWGAGHVGRAIVSVLAPMPSVSLTWVDDAPTRFPGTAPEGVTILPARDMPAAMRLAPAHAHHLFLTYSHEIDLALCHAALTHGFASCGLIGSATKWARFRKRLAQLGHSDARISGITCPIGDPGLGKHPQAIAVGVAASLLKQQRQEQPGLFEPGGKDMTKDIGQTRGAS